MVDILPHASVERSTQVMQGGDRYFW